MHAEKHSEKRKIWPEAPLFKNNGINGIAIKFKNYKPK
nr:MAG TPA: hypothetical protein [Caudoviricetes sp.]